MSQYVDRALQYQIERKSALQLLNFTCRQTDMLKHTSLLSNEYHGTFPGGKAAGAWSWALTFNQCRGQENINLYIHSSIHFHGVVLSKHRDNFTVTLTSYQLAYNRQEAGYICPTATANAPHSYFTYWAMLSSYRCHHVVLDSKLYLLGTVL
jgi:hypothetical protein